ncbi:MAG: molybdopterin-dependent oxidoreductase [Candidatus Bathyarchaeota archaeon]|nr:molybdopterin-dependent oxidoreductase [Candidatus Bathyarchaeota archaeon]
MKKYPFQTTTILLIIVCLTITSSLSQAAALASSESSNASTGSSLGTLAVHTSPNSTVSFSLDDLHAMPKTIVYAELSCFGRFIASGDWGGVSLGDLLANAGCNVEEANLQFHAIDGYTVNYHFSNSSSENVIVAYELDGNPLSETLRLVVPDANGEAWISMITEISVNNPIYANAVNPGAATAIIGGVQSQGTTLSPTPTPSIAPKETAQPTAQPTPTSQTNPTNQQAETSGQTKESKPSTLLVLWLIGAAMAVVIGFIVAIRLKRKG